MRCVAGGVDFFARTIAAAHVGALSPRGLFLYVSQRAAKMGQQLFGDVDASKPPSRNYYYAVSNR